MFFGHKTRGGQERAYQTSNYDAPGSPESSDMLRHSGTQWQKKIMNFLKSKNL